MASNSTDHNADELIPPNWLNKDFFKKVLQHIENNEKVEIDHLKLTTAAAKGDHVVSAIFRASIDFKLNNELKSKSLVLKTMPDVDGHIKEILGESFLFETEIGIYAEVKPRFEEILKSIGEETTLGPNMLYHSLDPKKIIIFEDLLPLGYKAHREGELSLNDLKSAFEKLAKWHAVSHKILKEQPSFFETYRHGLVNMKSFYESERIMNRTKYFIEMLGQHEDLLIYKPYFEALNKKSILMSSVDSYNEYWNNPKNSTFYVLCHGDFHYKNLMFKRNPKTGDLLDLMLLDFQLSSIGPVAIDLMYSFYLLLNGEQRQKHFDELLYWYYWNLKTTLEKIGFEGKIPKLFEMKKELFDHRYIELFLLTTFLPVFMRVGDKDFEPGEMAKSVEKQKELYKNPKYLAEVRAILPKYLYSGYLEL